MHLHLKLRKLQKEQERLSLIQRDNQMLQDRMACIMRSRGRLDNENLNYKQKSLNTTYRQMEMIRLAHENQAIIQRLMAVDPEYNHLRMEDEYRIHARRRQNIQKFPHWAQRQTQVVGQTRHLAGRGHGKRFHDQKVSTSKKNTVSLEESSYENQEDNDYSQGGYRNQSVNGLYTNAYVYNYSTDPHECPPFHQYPSHFQIVDIQTGNQYVVPENQHSTTAQLGYDSASSHERSHFEKNATSKIKSVSHSGSLNHFKNHLISDSSRQTYFENMKRCYSYEIQNAQCDIESEKQKQVIEYVNYYTENPDNGKTKSAAISHPNSSSSSNYPSLKAVNQQKISENMERSYSRETHGKKREDSESTNYFKQEQQQILKQLRESDYRHEMQINYGMTHKQEAGDSGPIDNSTSSVDESGNEGDSETSRESLDNIVIRTGPLQTSTPQRSQPSETHGSQDSSKVSSSDHINEGKPQENSLNIADSKEASILTRHPNTSEGVFQGKAHSYDKLITGDHEQTTLNSVFRTLSVDDRRINKLEESQMQSKSSLLKNLYNEKGKPNKNRTDHSQEESVPITEQFTGVATVQQLHSQVMFAKEYYINEKKRSQGKINDNTEKKLSVSKDEDTTIILPEKLKDQEILSSDTDNKVQCTKFYKDIIIESEQRLLSEHEQDFDPKRRSEIEYRSQESNKVSNKPIDGSQEIVIYSERKKTTEQEQKSEHCETAVSDETNAKELLNNQKVSLNRELIEESADDITNNFGQQNLSHQPLRTAETTKKKDTIFIKSAERFQEELNNYFEHKFLSGQNQDNDDSEIPLVEVRHESQKNSQTEYKSMVQNQAGPSKTDLVNQFIREEAGRSTAEISIYLEQQRLGKQNQDIGSIRTPLTEYNSESRDILLMENDAYNKEVFHTLQYNESFASSGQNQNYNYTEILTLNNLSIKEASLSQEEHDKKLHENIVASNEQRTPIQQNLESKKKLEINDRSRKEPVFYSKTKTPSNLNKSFENEGSLLLNNEPYIRHFLLTREEIDEEGQSEVHYVELCVEPENSLLLRDDQCIEKETLTDDDVLENHDKDDKERNKIQEELVIGSEKNHEILSANKSETEKESMSGVFDKDSTNQEPKTISDTNILWDISNTTNQETKEEGNELITELAKKYSGLKEKYNPNTTQLIDIRTEEPGEGAPIKKNNIIEEKYAEQSNELLNENSENILEERNEDGASVTQVDHNKEEKLGSLRESKSGPQYESNVRKQWSEYFSQNLNNLLNESGTKNNESCQGTFEYKTASEERGSGFYKTNEEDSVGTVDNAIESLDFGSQSGDNNEFLQTDAAVAHQSVRVNVTTQDRKCNASKCEVGTKYRSTNREHQSNENASIIEEYADTTTDDQV
ncbi:uncharacterized protein LOC106457528 [Limulus polyphemus]|uniref:Uncharacterized protein LOC106457528 n=1 Tax=Limulus polyphemus TaxID=6850 RepID=A0ABM1B0Q7_LIMPO|nr:uncharacterized protein LOC106457528 [Limulus polyphemus]